MRAVPSLLENAILRDSLASRPTPEHAGRLFHAIDEGVVYFDSGSVWEVFAISISAPLPAIVQSGTTYTFHIECAGRAVEGTNGSATTFTIPPVADVPWTVGDCIEVYQAGAGTITVAAGSGVLRRSFGDKYSTAGQYASIGLRMSTADVWVFTGSLA